MSEVEKALTDAYYWLSMYKSGAVPEGLAMEKVKEAIFDQPQLNENQRIVLEWLKGIAVKNDNAPIMTFSAFGYQHFGAELPTDVEKAYKSMNGKQDLGVMSAYVNWALEQEAEE